MSKDMVKYIGTATVAGVISVLSFSMYLDKLKFGKHRTKKVVEDIPEEEVEPEIED